MAITVACRCGAQFSVRDDLAGRQARCPTCGNLMTIPSGANEDDSIPGQLEPEYAPPVASSSPSGSPQPGAAAARTKIRLDELSQKLEKGFLGLPRVVGVVCLAAGMLLVVMSRGCETLAERSAQSATADYRATLAEHANSWKDKKAVLEDEIEDYREKLGLTGRRRANQDATRPNDEEQRKLWTTAMEKKQDELADLQREEVKDRRKLERGKWKSLRDRAEGAEYRAASGGYWRQSGFILGTMLLTLGLLVLAFIGDPGERKVCLVLITIIVFSLFVAGKAWGESVSSTLRDLIPANRR